MRTRTIGLRSCGWRNSHIIIQFNHPSRQPLSGPCMVMTQNCPLFWELSLPPMKFKALQRESTESLMQERPWSGTGSKPRCNRHDITIRGTSPRSLILTCGYSFHPRTQSSMFHSWNWRRSGMERCQVWLPFWNSLMIQVRKNGKLN